MTEYKFRFGYLSQNEAYEIHGRGRKKWIGKTNDFKKYQKNVGYTVDDEFDSDKPLKKPLKLWHTLKLYRCHRSNEHLEGLPYGDVGNPLKTLHDALEGHLYDDDSQIQQVHVKKESTDGDNHILTKCEIIQ